MLFPYPCHISDTWDLPKADTEAAWARQGDDPWLCAYTRKRCAEALS